MAHDTQSIQGERRIHHAVRKIFVRACVLLAPFVRDNDKILNTSNYAMLHVVQSHFPELSSSEAHIVITTVERLDHDGRLQALLDGAAAPGAGA